ncbi:hypothetical protein FQB35_00225 [Crassaminicella thermophila]|uniref:Amphi-Trp domain-containing protein n=1 Tax=Crassaminicella thermophila TaxID=2599308 RepID=A0A5C0SAG0_CRATE|nr:hypothetical protein [Crassaminicella thermophila]QEK10922.1 hypothetical protein FQB35_00225 [Crassaminicella thermophila]
MRYREKFEGNREEIYEQLKETVTNLFKGNLRVEEASVRIPKDKLLEYKVKYEDTPAEGQLSIKITWTYIEEPEEEVDEEF